jgi:hypothetical protein
MLSASRTRLVFAAVLCAALALRATFVAVSSPVDDAYITFRYASNLAAGHGFEYNRGEHVLGTTTPLFTLLIAPFAAAGFPPDRVGLALAVLFDLGVCALLFVIFRRERGDAAGLAAAGLYGLSYAAAAACGYGMETQLFMLLVLAAMVLVVAKRGVAAALVTALAVTTRPEGFLLAAMIGAAMLINADRRRQFARSLVVFVATAGAWYLFAWMYFGSPIPNSVRAKLMQTGISPAQWMDFFVTRNPVVMLLWVLAALGTFLGVRKRHEGCLLLAVWLVVYALFFLVVRPPFLGGWYFPPLIMPLTALASVALVWVGAQVLRTPGRALAATLLFAVALMVAVLPKSLASNRWNRKVASTVFVPLATWVRDNTPPGAVVHASDVGYLGYFSGRRILDAAALVTPDVGRYYAANKGRPDWDIAFVLERRPDVVVLPIRLNIYERFSRSAFAQSYRPVARFQVDGETDLNPPAGTADRYAADARFMADYIVYTRTR